MYEYIPTTYLLVRDAFTAEEMRKNANNVHITVINTKLALVYVTL